MTVDDYLMWLNRSSAHTAAALRPVAPVEMISLELALKRPLPAAYERFLTMVGCGRVGAGRWLHLDPTLSGNVLERRARIRQAIVPHRCGSRCRDPHCALDLYPIYEAEDGALYGFVRYGHDDGGFRRTIYSLRPGDLTLTVAAENFDVFLGQLAEALDGPSESRNSKGCAFVASSYEALGRRRPAPAAA